MPKLARILETALYVRDLDRAAAFYEHVLGLACIHSDYRMRAFDVSGTGVLLLFPEGGSLQPIDTPGGSMILTIISLRSPRRAYGGATSAKAASTLKIVECFNLPLPSK